MGNKTHVDGLVNFEKLRMIAKEVRRVCKFCAIGYVRYQYSDQINFYYDDVLPRSFLHQIKSLRIVLTKHPHKLSY